MIRRKTEDEIAAEKAAFEALPLIEQIRLVVKQEVRLALADRDRWETMTPDERMREQTKPRTDPGIPVYSTSLAEKGIKGLTTANLGEPAKIHDVWIAPHTLSADGMKEADRAVRESDYAALEALGFKRMETGKL